MTDSGQAMIGARAELERYASSEQDTISYLTKAEARALLAALKQTSVLVGALRRIENLEVGSDIDDPSDSFQDALAIAREALAEYEGLIERDEEREP